jgi:predicted metal-dependent TIM-barrel fold hydrolase
MTIRRWSPRAAARCANPPSGQDSTAARWTGFRDYYRQLTEYEPARAAKFLLPHYSWLCLNPKESEDLALARDVLALIPEFLSCPNVLGIGEIGLEPQHPQRDDRCSSSTSLSRCSTIS